MLDNLSIGSADVMTAKDCAALMMTSEQAKNHSRNLIQSTEGNIYTGQFFMSRFLVKKVVLNKKHRYCSL